MLIDTHVHLDAAEFDDDREQVIERIGPVRHMQAGFNRVVSIYNLMALRTFDRAVLDRARSKAMTQQDIMEAVRAV